MAIECYPLHCCNKRKKNKKKASGNLQIIPFFAAIISKSLASCMIQSLGIGKRKACLKPDAVPTLFIKPWIRVEKWIGNVRGSRTKLS